LTPLVFETLQRKQQILPVSSTLERGAVVVSQSCVKKLKKTPVLTVSVMSMQNQYLFFREAMNDEFFFKIIPITPSATTECYPDDRGEMYYFCDLIISLEYN
jgi:hypothetical protein